MNPESIYLRLPPRVQDWIVSAEGWRVKRHRYGGDFPAFWSEVCKRDGISGRELHGYQTMRLRAHLVAAASAPFWRETFRRYGLDPGADDPFPQLAKLPVLSKDEVKEHAPAIRNAGIAPRRLLSVHTSGTTGGGLVFWENEEAERERWAVWWRYRQRLGLDRDTWCGYFGGRSIVALRQQEPPFWRRNGPGRQLMFSAYHLRRATAPLYWEALRWAGVPWLHGYPSLLSVLAGFGLECGLPRLGAVKIITTGAESLFPHQRALLEKAFGVPVWQHYGQAESVANISQCRQGTLHVDEDFSFVEFLPLSGMPGIFRIVGTNWSNPAFPLLRYDTGDLATCGGGSCSCGSPWRRVATIDGRKEDVVILPNGSRVGRLDHIFKDLTEIKEAQIYQPDESTLVFRVVKGRDFDKLDGEHRLLAEARQRLGDEIKIELEYTDNIPRTHMGKLRFVVSDVDHGKTPALDDRIGGRTATRMGD